ncbi:MAG: rhodanese-like domain-containing protein [Desulfobacterales bacterium]|nr:rhodanese-like domain-containing protein [Desulfobacterales bacterium]
MWLKAGRIKGAVNLPTVQVFDKYPPGDHMEQCCWTYKDIAALKNMATGVVGSDLSKEIIVYCDSGRVASAWWFILREVMGYENVKSYDGSMEEWSKDETAPMEP